MELIEIIYTVIIVFSILFTAVFTFSFISYKLKQKSKNVQKNTLTVKPQRAELKSDEMIKASSKISNRATNYHAHLHKLQQTREIKVKSATPEKLRKKRIQRIVDLTHKNDRHTSPKVVKKKSVEIPKQRIQKIEVEKKISSLDGEILNNYLNEHSSDLKSVLRKTKIK